MTSELIRQFHLDLEQIHRRSHTNNETTIRSAFRDLLKGVSKRHHLQLLEEFSIHKSGKVIRPDGALVDELRQARGYWESKDEKDNLDAEISYKLAAGYPKDNIIFENSRTVVLIQKGQEVMRVHTTETDQLEILLNKFFEYEPPEVQSFRSAIAQFSADMPQLLTILHDHIEQAESNTDYVKARGEFINAARETINPDFSKKDADEMLIQHILTSEIFSSIFDNSQYHQENNIAQVLNKVAESFYSGDIRRKIDQMTRSYYGYIKRAAAAIPDHHEKQKFLKAIYENFYRAYNPEGADALGIVYTPNEIIKFMIG